MKKNITRFVFLVLLAGIGGCKKSGGDGNPPVVPSPLFVANMYINSTVVSASANNYNTSPAAALRFRFTNKVNRSTVPGALSVLEAGASTVPYNIAYENNDSTIVITAGLKYLTRYTLNASTALKSINGGSLSSNATLSFLTSIDSSRKFPLITDDALLTKVQEQTFKYFWDFGHPVSGLSRERNTSGDIVTSGGSGFGIMAIPVGISRNFITRAQGLQRMQTIVSFLKNTAVKVKGAFPHWINGATGAIVPFSANDNGADLVETSYLMMGLLTARQYFNAADASETNLRADINTLFNNVEWDYFRNGGQNVLYWHCNPAGAFTMNMKIQGWNECLITYVMAAASTTHGIPASVYTNGWKGTTGYLNGNTYYGYQLPLGSPQGGPLFLAHYSFLGINPNSLAEGGINFFTQNKNHTLINYNYCKANPAGFFGYSDSTWGLTASDIENGYTASSPTNDVGVIAPTAALSSMPYTPAESMAALKFYYYVLGDKLWKEYGFVDAFSLTKPWIATSTLAIDQGPIILMIENHRTKLLWNLFTSAPEVKAGLLSLGFTAPYL
ncbi:MAG: beta-glucosidase [Chitinophagaceae bacterium]|nr:MAG: beta-glucosidase [Chitinophagaceae bacterium]